MQLVANPARYRARLSFIATMPVDKWFYRPTHTLESPA